MKKGYFYPQEFVPDYIYAVLGDMSWGLIDDRQVITANQLRAVFGAAYVNTWMYNSNGSKYRGFRPHNCHVGAPQSAHKIGRGTDISFKTYSPAEAREYILSKPHLFPHIRRIEKIDTHLHYDCIDHPGDGILLFNP